MRRQSDMIGGLNPPVLSFKTEEEVSSPGIQSASRSWKRQGDTVSPGASRRSADLEFSPVRLCWMSNLKNYKIRNLCFIMPLRLLKFVIVAMGN